jgi:hypothetical protein
MSAADAETLVAKLAGYTAMYESLVPQVLAKELNIDGTKGTSGVPYCSKVAEGYAALTNKPSKCRKWSESDRLAAAKEYKSDATSGDCCPECLMGTDTNEYKARCTVDGFVGATVCGTNGTIGQESDFDVYMPGPPIAWKTAPVDCSTGPEHELTGQEEEDCGSDDCPKSCYASQAGFDAVDKIFQAGGYKDLTDMTSEEEAAWNAISTSEQFKGGIAGPFVNAVVSGSADATAKPSLTAKIADNCLGLLAMPTMGQATLALKKGPAYIYKPTVLEGATIDVSPATGDSVKVTILGGSSKGKVTVTNPGSSSSFYIYDLVNEKEGAVTITGIKDGFISKVTNKGTFVATDTIGSAVGIINEGTIKIKGTSDINLVITSNTGTIEFDDNVKGTLSVPKDQMSGIEAPAGVTVTETDALGDSSASTAALASGVVAMALVAASLIF